MHHYAFNVGDYIKDTIHLELLQHGAYRRLLDWYYASEKPLPNDLTFLARVCGAQTATEKKAVESVLCMFFQFNESSWTHKRVEKEIAKYRAKSKAGVAGMDSRYQTEANFDNKPDIRSDNKPDKNQYAHDNQEPRTNKQEPSLMLEADASEPETAVLSWSKDRGWEGVTDKMRQEWKLAYPACDPDTQMAVMDQWLKANPQKSKKQLWLKFMTGWMSRSQERGGDVAKNPVGSNPAIQPQKKEGGAGRSYADLKQAAVQAQEDELAALVHLPLHDEEPEWNWRDCANQLYGACWDSWSDVPDVNRREMLAKKEGGPSDV